MGNICQRRRIKKINNDAEQQRLVAEQQRLGAEQSPTIEDETIQIKDKQVLQTVEDPLISDEELMQILKEVQIELQRDKKKLHFRSRLKSKIKEILRQKEEEAEEPEEPRYFYRFVCRNDKQQKIKQKIIVDDYYEEEAKSIYVQELVSKLVDSQLINIGSKE